MTRNHHTKIKGDIGVLKAQCACAEQGWGVLVPLTEHAHFDFVIYKDNMFKRVQAKYRSKGSNGTLEVQFKSTWSDKSGIHIQKTDKSQLDLYAVYCPETDEVYFFDPNQYKSSITLRVDKPKNGQTKNIKFAKNFLQVP